jgi:hypothetical protein
MNKAVGMLEGVAAAGKSVANDIVTAAQRAATPSGGTTGGAPGAAPGDAAGGSQGSAGATPPVPTTPPGVQPS